MLPKLIFELKLLMLQSGESDKGQSKMFAYGWIENAVNNNIIWEMTYSMTFHAGGSRKNRLGKTTLFLDKQEYRLRFVTDNSHSYNKWNDDPPDDAQYWGIIIYKETNDEH